MNDAHIHDYFCRCRDCKPPLVGEVTRGQSRWVVGLAVLGALVVFVWICGHLNL